MISMIIYNQIFQFKTIIYINNLTFNLYIQLEILYLFVTLIQNL